MWYSFCNKLNNLEHLHSFVSTQGTQVVLLEELTERSGKKHAEVHEQVAKLTSVEGTIFNIYSLNIVFIVYENYI